MSQPTWDHAYYLPEKREGVTVSYVIQKRDSGTPIREGDLWSSKVQYENGTGLQLLAVKCDGKRDYFRAWPREYQTDRWRKISRRAGISRTSASHSYRFHHLFEDLLEAMQNDPEIMLAFSVHGAKEGPDIGKKNGADIVIDHKDNFPRKRTLVSITDKFRKREVSPSEEVFSLNIQKWTDENCQMFNKYGKELILSYWKRHVASIRNREQAAVFRAKEVEENERIGWERARKTEVNVQILLNKVQRVVERVSEDEKNAATLLKEIEGEIEGSSYSEILAFIDSLDHLNSILEGKWLGLREWYEDSESTIKVEYIAQKEINWHLSLEQETLRSLDHFSEEDVPDYYHDSDFFADRGSTLFDLGIRLSWSGINSRSQDTRELYQKIRLYPESPTMRRLRAKKEDLKKKSLAVFEKEFPEKIESAREKRDDLKKERDKYLREKHEPLVSRHSLLSENVNRSYEEETEAYFLEHDSIPKSLKIVEEYDRQINESLLRIARREYHQE